MQKLDTQSESPYTTPTEHTMKTDHLNCHLRAFISKGLVTSPLLKIAALHTPLY